MKWNAPAVLACGAFAVVMALSPRPRVPVVQRTGWVPSLGSSERGANYIEGPSPIRLRDGSIALLFHEGYCCHRPLPLGPGWEQIAVALIPPGEGQVTVMPLLRHTDDYEAKTYELGFVSAVLERDTWLLAFTRTTFDALQNGWTNVARISTWQTPDLTTPGRIAHDVVGPALRECQQRGTCLGLGVAGPALVVQPDGRTMLWYRDDVRLRPEDRFRVFVQEFRDGRPFGGAIEARFVKGGQRVGPTITDVGVGPDGRIYVLSSDWLWDGITEWVSDVDDPFLLTPTGVVLKTIDGLAVWDGAYLRDPAGRIEQPRIVVGVAAPYGAAADSGQWRLVWYAEDGARVPEAWRRAVPYPPMATPSATPPPPPPMQLPAFQFAVPDGSMLTGLTGRCRQDVSCTIEVWRGGTLETTLFAMPGQSFALVDQWIENIELRGSGLVEFSVSLE